MVDAGTEKDPLQSIEESPLIMGLGAVVMGWGVLPSPFLCKQQKVITMSALFSVSNAAKVRNWKLYLRRPLRLQRIQEV